MENNEHEMLLDFDESWKKFDDFSASNEVFSTEGQHIDDNKGSEDKVTVPRAELDDVAYGRSVSVSEGDGEQWSSRHARVTSRGSVRDEKWQLNCHEAAIYLQEGSNNDKFTNHPKTQAALPAYLVTHNQWFYSLNLVAAVTLLALSLLEQPAVFPVHVAVHASLELFCLMVVTLELALRMRWLGCQQFFKHRRTLVKSICLLVMIAESVTVLVRQSSHLRVTRALRPLYLLDCYHMKAVRRFVRQVLQSLPAILDMLGLLLFFMLLFSLLGFFLFHDIPDNKYFDTIQDSFVSLFILLTTANFPDVMQPAYAHNKWSAVFFIVYLSMELYLFMNLLLAVVYDSFLNLEKIKLRNLLLHKRAACERAFRLLVSKQNPNGVSIRSFEGLMKYYKPRMSRQDVYLAFKVMNVSRSGVLSHEEFYTVYDHTALKWKHKKTENCVWSAKFPYPFNKAFKGIHRLVTWKWFQVITYVVITLNFVWILADTVDISVKQSHHRRFMRGINDFVWISSSFVLFYILEASLKILGLGPHEYFTSGWNVFDFMVTVAAAVSVLLEFMHRSYYFMLIFRPLRLLRLFKLKARYRDVLGTIFILSSILVSISIVILIVYYVFAIVGMEVFASYDMKNCCRNSDMEPYYRYNSTEPDGYYYLSGFHNILLSGVTLFELTVVNNWYIIMEGYAITVSEWTRVYFMLFYLVTMVIMTVVVTFILEAFMFRMQYRSAVSGHDLDGDAMMKVDVSVSVAELAMCKNSSSYLTHTYITSPPPPTALTSTYRGERLRSKDDFSVIMHRQLVAKWIEEYDKQRNEKLRETRDCEHDIDTQRDLHSSNDLDTLLLDDDPLLTLTQEDASLCLLPNDNASRSRDPGRQLSDLELLSHDDDSLPLDIDLPSLSRDNAPLVLTSETHGERSHAMRDITRLDKNGDDDSVIIA